MLKQSSLLFLAALFCALAMVIALVMQYQFDMEPCPLCISQRIFIILVGVAALAGALISSRKLALRCTTVLMAIFGVIGAIVAGRHVWIQNLPEDEAPLCGPSLAYMFETRPMFDALNLLFKGDGHCADVSFTLLGLSIPGWTLVSFIGLILLAIFVFIRSFRV